MPGATVGLQTEDPTIAELLKPLGYATGQFGKNHLGDRDEFLPTVHGFDEFFGNLYHLNAEEEPELPDYPKDPGVQEAVRPARRAPLHRRRQGRADDQGHRPADQEAHGDDRRGDHRRRRSTWMEKQAKADKPFFLWYNSTAMHFRTHVAEKNRRQERPGRLQRSHGRARRADRPDARQARRARHRRQHDRHVLDRQRSRERHLAGRRQHAVPRPEEHELGGRLARAVLHALARARSSRARCSTASSRTRTCCRRCWRPPAIRTSSEKLLKGYKVGNKTFKVHIDGFNMLPYLTGEAKESPRNVLLLQRRRRRDGGAHRRLEVRVRGAARQRRCRSGRSRS